MFDREKILKSAKSSEDRLFFSKIIDRISSTEKKGYTTYCGFLDPRQQMLLKRIEPELPVSLLLYGGYQAAERQMAAFYERIPEWNEFPISILEGKAREISSFSHRDILGSLMGLGLKREKIGDILIDETVKIIVSDDVAQYILFHLEKIGNRNIQVDYYTGVLTAPERKQKIIRDTVVSLRLDTICAVAFGISRSSAVKLIQQQRVFVNYEMIDNVSHILKGGDILSAKGYGKAEFDQVTGKSRKDRYIIVMKKYI